MRRYVFASHHQLAEGLKDTTQFLNNYSEASQKIYTINAYVDKGEDDITDRVKALFDSFDAQDEVIVLTDMMGGSVNQKFLPYLSEKVHVITGMNLALAMSFLLMPEDIPFTSEMVNSIVEDCKSQIIYMNAMQSSVSDDDE